MKSEQFKLTLSLGSSCGGYRDDDPGHVLITNKQKQIFFEVFSTLSSTGSTCTGLSKINKLNIPFCWNDSFPGWRSGI